MSTPVATHDWLTEPEVEFFRDDDGAIEAAYIRFRTGKLHRVEQPNLDFLAFLYLGIDGVPIGVKLLQPVPGVVKTQIVYRLIVAPDGNALGVDRRVRSSFVPTLPSEFVDSTIHHLDAACGQLAKA